MHFARLAATATLLPDGRVLVAGGFRQGIQATTTAEVYNPRTNAWASVPSMPPSSTSGGLATDPGELAFYSAPLPSGKVLVVGGWTDESYATSTVFDPATGSWTTRDRVPGAPEDSGLAAATQLADGRILVVTNCKIGGQTPKAAIYGPLGWASVASPPSCGFSLANLPSGRTLFADVTQANIYDASADQWTAAPPYRFPHAAFGDSTNVVQVAPVPRGALLIDQGLNSFSSAERFFEP